MIRSGSRGLRRGRRCAYNAAMILDLAQRA
jgi:hypothetical protein